MPLLTTLAPELLLKILDCLLTDPPSLLRCAHVCGALRPYALEVFFRDTELVETTHSVNRTREFAQLLESNHTIASYIRTLRLGVDLSGHRETDDRGRLWNPFEHPYVLGSFPLPLLSELRELVLNDGMMLWDPAREVVSVLKAVPRLERLTLQGVLVASMPMPPMHRSPTALSVAQNKPPLSLKTLDIEHAPSFPVYELVRRLLEEFGDGLRLETLVARCVRWQDLFEHHDGWIPFISAMKTSLRHLDISTGERNQCDWIMTGSEYDSDERMSFHTSLFHAVRECEALRTLHLDYVLPSWISSDNNFESASFLRSLCVLLENRPAFSNHLEQLSLNMTDWHEIAVSVDRASGHRLSRVLTDATRYPKLTMFSLEVQIDGTPGASDEEVSPLEEDEDCEEVTTRWIDAFEGFVNYVQANDRLTFEFTAYAP
ncbi:hypothetical protein L226DRAFT_540349 [Lentinus tigrinus ALCF2SS1-7]|uniref:F-box domain-containing protein n=1 Tax=Lentinus tigrinus ALCF2SS1-6 TaxID=1328759 RepID=A0A5C2RTN4_9APHY|nr:hypothetical protein L227DRAFT_657985 [Lentinus tigrinus ALCF2SS1-6]RPD68818.1 hypothetical protein L226DRAFT_540349 [Lentinus tigrinus ALCF2SS1-7]